MREREPRAKQAKKQKRLIAKRFWQRLIVRARKRHDDRLLLALISSLTISLALSLPLSLSLSSSLAHSNPANPSAVRVSTHIRIRMYMYTDHTLRFAHTHTDISLRETSLWKTNQRRTHSYHQVVQFSGSDSFSKTLVTASLHSFAYIEMPPTGVVHKFGVEKNWT